MVTKLKKYHGHMIALLGMAMLQTNNLPLIYQTVISHNPVNLLTPILTLCGLLCYLYYAVFIRRDIVYIIGNSIGIVSSSILIYVSV